MQHALKSRGRKQAVVSCNSAATMKVNADLSIMEHRAKQSGAIKNAGDLLLHKAKKATPKHTRNHTQSPANTPSQGFVPYRSVQEHISARTSAHLTSFVVGFGSTSANTKSIPVLVAHHDNLPEMTRVRQKQHNDGHKTR